MSCEVKSAKQLIFILNNTKTDNYNPLSGFSLINSYTNKPYIHSTDNNIIYSVKPGDLLHNGGTYGVHSIFNNEAVNLSRCGFKYDSVSGRIYIKIKGDLK